MADTLHAAVSRRVRRQMMDPDRTNEREFYRYYHHSQRPKGDSRQASPAVPVSLPSPAPPVALRGPRPSEDKALTAFAQLGALRMNTRRCLISFFDRRDCYILAEATKTSSLSTGQAEIQNDSLCWGQSIFPKESSICYYTVKLPFLEPSLHDEYATVPSLVVNDLTQDDRFKHYPFVLGAPYSRFYAGVPIRSPSGHSIGTYCVLDDKPRDGLSTFELAFLKDMATTVMRHLQMSRATDDHKRGGVMVKSLGSFADGRSTLEEWLDWDADGGPAPTEQDDVDTQPDQRRHRQTLTPRVPSTHSLPTAAHGPALLARNNSNSSSTPSLQGINSTTPSATPSSTVVTPVSDPIDDSKPEVTTKTASSTTNDAIGTISPELKTIFSRAAQMIVDATEAEGAVFFDAKVSTWGGLVDDEVLSEQAPEPDKPCVLLGAAHFKEEQESAPSSHHYSMSENVLKQLLRNYAHGQIFNMEDDPAGPIPSADIPSEDPELALSRRSESLKSSDDENTLKEVFPNARSLILYPLRDTHRDRWFASLVIWSSDPMRVFTSEQELSYLAAFSNSVMAEVARLDTKLADSAKADFISSISHELRSPLHGILGMTDLLKETQIDSQQDSHIQTIETCGKTLLDTINHVLDYAKINNLTRGSSKRRIKRSKSAKQINSGGGHTNDIMTIISDVDMSVLAEEALDSVFAGFHFQQSAALDKSSTDPDVLPVAVIVDISKSDTYVFRTQPGAWRRVIMNLFGNALKYTPAGFIKVKLQVLPNSAPNDDCAELRLTVADSGIGMSESYINNRLFHSFAQENPLSQGTGLGLSIVKQLVELLGGDVEVRSERGRGTKFTVSCPLKTSTLSPSPSAPLPDRIISNIRKRVQGLNVHFVGFDEEDDYFPVKSFKSKNATRLTKKAVDSLCVDWFGIKTWNFRAADAPAPDLFMATESGARFLRSRYSQDPKKAPCAPVVVVCRGAASAQSNTAITVPGLIFECTAQPCGPHKLAKALSSCLDRHAHGVMGQSTATDVSITPQMSQLNLKENLLPLHKRLSSLAELSRPAMNTTMSAPEIRSLNNSPVKRTPPSMSINCLAVDDNRINLRLLRTFVAKLGHTHVLAKTGLEALDAYKTNTLSLTQPKTATDDSASLPAPTPLRIDVILMDINMPEMDGLEATRQIRAHERENGLSPTTIIALTGVASTDAQQEAHASGVNMFLIKPVRLAELDVILKGVIKGNDQAETTGRISEATEGGAKETIIDEVADQAKERSNAEAHARSQSEI